jgi:hypothetical protein
MAYDGSGEVDDILRELVREPGAIGAALVGSGEDPEEIAELKAEQLRRVPLGQGAELVVAVAGGAPAELAAAIERAARELRACLRYHESEGVPRVELIGRLPRSRAALLRKATLLLEALLNMQNAAAATVLRRAEVLAAAGDLNEARRERLAFLRKRIDAEAARLRGQSSHGEALGPDVFACSFWFDAYLVLFFDRPYSPDFVRHRARAVTRELAQILPHLDEDPTTPAAIKPLPPTT